MISMCLMCGIVVNVVSVCSIIGCLVIGWYCFGCFVFVCELVLV